MEIPAVGHHDGSDGARDPRAGPLLAEYVGRVFAILLGSTCIKGPSLYLGGRREMVGVLELCLKYYCRFSFFGEAK